jgi:hypothetical protein
VMTGPAQDRGTPLDSVRSAWTAIDWPFGMDEWGKALAFACSADDCGAEAKLYFRPEIGFCSCSAGVYDDSELDRLSDFSLAGGDVRPVGEGHAVHVGWMKGRSRAYTAFSRGTVADRALSIAFNDECDALVATVVAPPSGGPIEQIALSLLNSERIISAVRKALGL